MSETLLKVSIEDEHCVKHEMTVTRSSYVKSKTKQLRDFGYSDLTNQEVEEQIDAVLQKKPFGKDGLTIIGMMMEKEVLSQTKGVQQ